MAHSQADLKPVADPLRTFQRAAMLAKAKPSTLIARLRVKFQSDEKARTTHVTSALHYLSQPINANRVFNGFPELLDEKEQLGLINDYKTLLKELKKTNIDTNNHFKLLDNYETQKNHKDAEAFKQKIIVIAFRELLDKNGNVKRELAELLTDSKEEKAIDKTQELLLNIPVLSGYVGEVMLHITHEALQTMSEKEREDNFIQHLALAPIFSAGYTDSIKELLLEKELRHQTHPKHDDAWVLQKLREIPEKFPKATLTATILAGVAAIALVAWGLFEKPKASIELDIKKNEAAPAAKR